MQANRGDNRYRARWTVNVYRLQKREMSGAGSAAFHKWRLPLCMAEMRCKIASFMLYTIVPEQSLFSDTMAGKLIRGHREKHGCGIDVMDCATGVPLGKSECTNVSAK